MGRFGETGGMLPECAARWQLMGTEESSLDNRDKLKFRSDICAMVVAAMSFSVDLLIISLRR